MIGNVRRSRRSQPPQECNSILGRHPHNDQCCVTLLLLLKPSTRRATNWVFADFSRSSLFSSSSIHGGWLATSSPPLPSLKFFSTELASRPLSFSKHWQHPSTSVGLSIIVGKIVLKMIQHDDCCLTPLRILQLLLPLLLQ